MACTPNLLQFNDEAHLVHVVIDAAMHSESTNSLRRLHPKFEVLFKHAVKLEKLFRSLCLSNGVSEAPAIVPTRWYSLYECVKLLNSCDVISYCLRLIKAIVKLLSDSHHRQVLYAQLTNRIQHIHQIQN